MALVEFTEALLLGIETQRNSRGARAKLDRYLEMLSLRAGEHVLDVGCGGGSFCRTVAPLVAPDGTVIGVDPSPVAIGLAARLAAADDSTGVTFSCADGVDLPFPDASFDAAACISVLEFCREPGRVLTEIRRVLRPGGRLLVANADEDTRVFNGRDRELGRRLTRAIADRGVDPWLGRRLASMLKSSGFHLEHETVLIDLERDYAPETSGYTHAHLWRDYLLRVAGVPAQDYERWLDDLVACARDGSYCYSVVTFAYLAVR